MREQVFKRIISEDVTRGGEAMCRESATAASFHGNVDKQRIYYVERNEVYQLMKCQN